MDVKSACTCLTCSDVAFCDGAEQKRLEKVVDRCSDCVAPSFNVCISVDVSCGKCVCTTDRRLLGLFHHRKSLKLHSW